MNKRNKILICIVIALVTTGVIIFSRKPKDYSITYDIDGYHIYEKYEKDLNMYYFSTTIDENIIEIAVNNNYLHNKKLISEIKNITTDDVQCLYMKSQNLNTYPICIKDGNNVAYSILNLEDDSFYKLKEYKSTNNTYGNIEVFSITDKKIAIWNHYGFDYFEDINKKGLTLLKSESYRDNHSFIVDEYIILPDYDSKYQFDKVYLIDLKKGSTSTWNLGANINYDFYILGIKDSKAYLIDKKDKVEYELIPKNKKINVISKNGIGKIWSDKWEDESIVKLSTGDYSFKENSIFSYEIKNDKLIMKIINSDNEITVSNKKIDKIIQSDNMGAYYLSKNELYYFSHYTGEVLCMRYSEFEFNKGLSIYIY